MVAQHAQFGHADNVHVSIYQREKSEDIEEHFLQQLLKDYYKTQFKNISRPFTKLLGEELPDLKMENCFVNITLVNKKHQTIHELNQLSKLNNLTSNLEQLYTSYEDIYRLEDKQHIEPEELFLNQEKCHLLCTGRAGIGKTILSEYLCYQWAIGKLWKNRFNFIFLIKLRNLSNDQYALPINYPGDIYYKECFNSASSEYSKLTPKNIQDCLASNSSFNILIILEGYDEFNLNSPCAKVIQDILKNKEVCLLVTTRPFTELCEKNFDKSLKCVGFTNKQIKKFIKLKEICPEKPKQDDIIHFLIQNPAIYSVVHVPLLLEIFCLTWNKDFLQKKNMTLTSLFEKIIRKLWEHYQNRIRKTNPTISNNELVKKENELEEFMLLLAFRANQKNKILLDSQIIEEIICEKYKCKSHQAQLYLKEIIECGFLYSPDESKYYFPHLSFQEYFTANYICKNINNSDVNTFILENNYNPRYEYIWWFVSGLLKDNESELQSLFNKIFIHQNDKLGLYNILLTIRCLEESNRVLNESQKKILNQWVEFSYHYSYKIIDFIVETLKYSLNIYNQIKQELFLTSFKKSNDILRTQSLLFYLKKFMKFDDTIIEFLKAHLKHTSKYISFNIAFDLLECGLSEKEIDDLVFQALKQQDNFLYFEQLKNIRLPSLFIEKLIMYLHELIPEDGSQEDVQSILSVLTNTKSNSIKLYSFLIEILQNDGNDKLLKFSAFQLLVTYYSPDETLIRILIAAFSKFIEHLENLGIFSLFSSILLSYSNQISPDFLDFLNQLYIARIKLKQFLAEPDIKTCISFYNECQEMFKKRLPHIKVNNKHQNLQDRIQSLEARREFDNKSSMLFERPNELAERTVQKILTNNFDYADVLVFEKLSLKSKEAVRVCKLLLKSGNYDYIITAKKILISINYFDDEIFEDIKKFLIDETNRGRYCRYLEEDISVLIYLSQNSLYFLKKLIQDFNSCACYREKHTYTQILGEFDLTELLDEITKDKNDLTTLLKSTPLLSLLKHALYTGKQNYYRTIISKLIEGRQAIFLAKNNNIIGFYEGGIIRYCEGDSQNVNNLFTYFNEAINSKIREFDSLLGEDIDKIARETSEVVKEISDNKKEKRNNFSSRYSFAKTKRIQSFLSNKILNNLSLGKAIDNGDCFFDSLTQILNEINNTDVNTVKYLRMLCHDFYLKNKKVVDDWNQKDFAGVDKGKDDYYMVQYTCEECEQHFHGRSPIWGRPWIEGIILCQVIKLEGMLVIEILEEPETKNSIISYHLATEDSYKSISEEDAQQYLNNPNIPILAVEQNSLHFVPLLRSIVDTNNEQQIKREKTLGTSSSFTFGRQ